MIIIKNINAFFLKKKDVSVKRSLLLILVWHSLTIAVGYCQSRIIPPAPEAYALGKYGDVPVGLYTGVPQITIPITTIADKDILVDVNLSYHSAGVKVDEVASYVGLGWTLNAGGAITRVARHKAEYPASNGQIMPARAYIPFYTGQSQAEATAYVNNSDLQGTVYGGRDSEPDEFAFNFMGRSGKFHIDSAGSATLYNHEGMDVRFEYSGQSQSRFVIKDANGTVYRFAETEYSTYVDNMQSAITSWYLSEIESPKGGMVSIEYQGFPALGMEGREFSEHIVEVTSNPGIYVLNSPTMVSDVMEKKVKKIITSNGTVEFKHKTTRRLDLRMDSYALEEIILAAPNGMVIKRYKLSTSYFEANNNRKYTGSNATTFSYLNYRLRLDAVQEFDAANQPVKKPYQITYLGDNNPATSDAYTLPYRLSASQDHWGYYNNKTNANLFPGNPEGRFITVDKTYERFIPDAGIGVNNTFLNGADRTVDTAAVKAGLIKELHHPTGGRTAFVFESNAFNWFTLEYGCGVRIKEMVDYTEGQVVAYRKSFSYESGQITNRPVDNYYRNYPVHYSTTGSPKLPAGILQAFGLPTNNGPASFPRRFVKIRALPQVVLGGSSLISYGKVTETVSGNGRTEYFFANAGQFPDYSSTEDLHGDLEVGQIQGQFMSQFVSSIYFNDPFEGFSTYPKGIGISDFPYPPLYSNEWKRGVMTSQQVFSELNVPVKKVEKVYNRQLMKIIKGWKVVGLGNSTQYIIVHYRVPQGWIYQTKEKVTTYDVSGQNPQIKETDFFYDNPVHAQLTRSSMLRSDGTRETTQMLYPQDYAQGTPFIDNMKTAHLIGYPIEQVNYKEVGTTRTILSGQITRYLAGGKGQVDQVLELETPRPIALSAFKFSNRAAGQLPPVDNATAFAPFSGYKARLTYSSYDSYGNPQQVTQAAGPSTVYLWGYRGQFPVAEIRNATFAEVVTALGGTATANTVFANLNSSTVAESYVRNTLGGLRSHAATTKSQTGIYTYKPLMGMGSATDASGRTTYYSYDGFGRLKDVKNTQQQVTEGYQYNYRNQ